MKGEFRQSLRPTAAASGPISDVLLDELITGIPATGTTSPRVSGTTQSRASRRFSVYHRMLRIIALVGVLALAAGLWYAGAYFTLGWLRTTRGGSALAILGIAVWLIPAAITAIEITLSPRRERDPLMRLAWLVILVFDVGTTAAGVQVELRLDPVTLLVPVLGAIGVVGGIIGGILAYAPEKAAVRAVTALWYEIVSCWKLVTGSA